MMKTNFKRQIESQQHNPNIAGIVLAAGGSERMGKPKQLLKWNGIPLIRHIVQTGLSSNLQSLYVVIGAYKDEIQKTIIDLPIEIIHNPNWKNGQSESIKAGIKALPSKTEAAIFILSDQPFLNSEIINALIQSYHQTKRPIIIPVVNQQRTNPVLFSHTTFDDLMQLSGDIGGRKLFDAFDTHQLQWHDEKLLLDIDTINDYKRLSKFQSKEKSG